MLVAQLTRELAQEVPPSASENRRVACERLGINPNNMPKAALEVELSKDDDFILNQSLASMSLLFTEYVGFVLFRTFGANVQHAGSNFLNNHSYQLLARQYAFEQIRADFMNEKFDDHDLLAVFWLSFVDFIRDMLLGEWGQSYRAAPVKIRFIFSKETRERLYRAVQETDGFMKKRSLMKVWATGVSNKQGLFEYVKSCV